MKNAYLALTAPVGGNSMGGFAPSARARFGNRSSYGRPDQPRFCLTSREREVLALLCAGMSNKLISRQLGITGSTVKTHVAAILRELGVMSRVQAVVCAYKYELVEENDEPATAAGVAQHTASASSP